MANAAFTAVEKEDNEPPLWKQLATPEMGKDLLKYLLIGAIVAYILLAVVRPILRTMFPPPSPEVEEEEGEEGEEDVEVDLTAMGGDLILATYEGKMQKAREIAHADPKAVANIIKDWMGVNAG